MIKVRWGATSGNPDIHPGSMITYVGVEHRLDLSVLGQLAQVPVPVHERLGTVQDLHVGLNNKPSVAFCLSVAFAFSSFTVKNEEGKSNERRFNAMESDWKLPRKTKVPTKFLWSRG